MADADSTPEVWRHVPAHPGYQASDRGRVIGPRGRVLRPVVVDGRPRVHVARADAAPIKRYAYHLVLEAFRGPRPDGMEACHADDEPMNNALANLRWDTPKANAVDRRRNGRQPRGANINTATMSEETAQAIFANRSDSVSSLAARFGVSVSAVRGIVSGKTWKHLAPTGATGG